MPTFEETIDKATAWDGQTDKRITHGIVYQAIDRDGTTLLAHASGTAHPSSSPATATASALTPDSAFLLASCTKLLTSICALQCVERGLIGLDDPLDAHLPELCAQPIVALAPTTTGTAGTADVETPDAGADDANAVKLTFAPRTRPLTLRHLLTHTAGLAYEKLHPVLGAWRAATAAARDDGDGGAAAAGDIVRDYSVPLVHEPGRGWTYGVGTDWVGKLVERLNSGASSSSAGAGVGGTDGDGGSGEKTTTTTTTTTTMNLEEYMRRNIWEPLGMRDTTFLLAGRPDVEARLVRTAERGRGDGEGLREKAEVWPPRRPRDCLGGDGMCSTVRDYVRVLRDLMREGGPTLLKRETAELLFAPQLASEEARRDLKASMELMGVIWGGAVPDGVRLDYGLGGLLYMDDDPNTGMKSGTLTWAGNGNLLWFLNRDANGGKGVGAFFATQLMPSGGPEISGLIKQFIQEVWRQAG